MPNFCIKCGTKLDESVKFCPVCGCSTDAKEAASAKISLPLRKSEKIYPAKKSNNKNIAIIACLVVFIILLGAVGGYYFYTQQKQKAISVAAQEQAAKTASDKITAAKQEERNKIKMYARNTVENLKQGQIDLKNLADDINSGYYDKDTLLRRESNIVALIENRRTGLKSQMQPSDTSIIAKSDELFSIQIQRANCMARGMQGDTHQYSIGRKYSDDFDGLLYEFKRIYKLPLK